MMLSVGNALRRQGTAHRALSVAAASRSSSAVSSVVAGSQQRAHLPSHLDQHRQDANHHCQQQQRQQHQRQSSLSFSTKAAPSYKEKKAARKLANKALYDARMARLERCKTRRTGEPQERQKIFRSWYDKRRTYHEIMDRKARQAGLGWKIEAAAVLERLPVVTPDIPDWEREYDELKSYLASFGKEYPKQLRMAGAYRPPGKVTTYEEMLGKCPILVCKDSVRMFIVFGFVPCSYLHSYSLGIHHLHTVLYRSLSLSLSLTHTHTLNLFMHSFLLGLRHYRRTAGRIRDSIARDGSGPDW